MKYRISSLKALVYPQLLISGHLISKWSFGFKAMHSGTGLVFCLSSLPLWHIWIINCLDERRQGAVSTLCSALMGGSSVAWLWEKDVDPPVLESPLSPSSEGLVCNYELTCGGSGSSLHPISSWSLLALESVYMYTHVHCRFRFPEKGPAHLPPRYPSPAI